MQEAINRIEKLRTALRANVRTAGFGDGNAKVKVTVGVSPSARYKNGMPVTEVAQFLEYGTVNMAPRPFMRYAAAAYGQRWRRRIAAALRDAIMRGVTPTRALASVTRSMADDVRQSMTEVGIHKRTGTLAASIKAHARGNN